MDEYETGNLSADRDPVQEVEGEAENQSDDPDPDQEIEVKADNQSPDPDQEVECEMDTISVDVSLWGQHYCQCSRIFTPRRGQR